MDTAAPISWLETLRPLPGIFVFDFARYLGAALLCTVTLTMLGRLRRNRRAVRSRDPVPGQKQRELLRSMRSALVFALAGLAIYHGANLGVLQVYDDIELFGWGYWLASLALIVVAHDTYFYWTHRLLHLHALFSWTHRIHHRSVAPTPWTAYSFSIAEAAVQASFAPIFLLLVPTHTTVLFIWMAHQILRNVQGHCGVELLPKSWLAGWWGRLFTTTLHHDVHHSFGRCNYGLYFTHWDRWCNTEHPDYPLRLRRLIDRLDQPA